jgi:threonine dehydrogenase-like Zn-dependent dehydrogenase
MRSSRWKRGRGREVTRCTFDAPDPLTLFVRVNVLLVCGSDSAMFVLRQRCRSRTSF